MNSIKYTHRLLITSIAAVLVFGINTMAIAQTANFEDHPATPAGPVPTTGAPFFPIFPAPLTAPADAPYTFGCGASSCTLTMADCCIVGDRYELFDYGISIGLTSVPGPDGSAGPYSTGTFCLGPGLHSISAVDLHPALPAVFYPAGSTMTVTQNPADVECTPVAGGYMPIDGTALLLAGISSSAVWLVPVITGLAGAGLYLTRSKFNWI